MIYSTLFIVYTCTCTCTVYIQMDNEQCTVYHECDSIEILHMELYFLFIPYCTAQFLHYCLHRTFVHVS